MNKPLLPTVLLEEKSVSKLVSNPYLRAATSDNTRLAYRSDIREYEKWGGMLPANPEQIVRYLEVKAVELSFRTLARRLVSLRNWHKCQGFVDPTAHPMIAKTLLGIARVHGKPKDKAPPLTPDHLCQIAHYLKTEKTLAAARDNALLQIGFLGALRRSELVAIQIEHIKWEKEGIEILLPVSKTDQTHQGQYCAIPNGNQKLCAVNALKRWLDKAALDTGPLFRRILRNGDLGDKALTPLSVNHILKQRAQEVGIQDAISFRSHSLRRGFATSAAKAGVSLQSIMRHGRWKQVSTVIEYVEAGERFVDNAANKILDEF